MLKQIHTISFYTLIEALRHRLIWLIVIIAFIGIGLSGFLNELAITESTQLQIALLATFLRFATVFLLATFVVTSMVREMNDKGLELLLAFPLPRSSYLMGKLLGFALLAVLPACLFGALIALFADLSQTILWTMSLILELWIVIAFATLCVLSMSQILGALSATMGFYLFSRSISSLLMIANDPLSAESTSQQWMHYFMKAIAHIIPKLDQFTQTNWLVYQTGEWVMLTTLLVQSSLIIVLLGAAAMFDLYRKNI